MIYENPKKKLLKRPSSKNTKKRCLILPASNLIKNPWEQIIKI